MLLLVGTSLPAYLLMDWFQVHGFLPYSRQFQMLDLHVHEGDSQKQGFTQSRYANHFLTV